MYSLYDVSPLNNMRDQAYPFPGEDRTSGVLQGSLLPHADLSPLSSPSQEGGKTCPRVSDMAVL